MVLQCTINRHSIYRWIKVFKHENGSILFIHVSIYLAHCNGDSDPCAPYVSSLSDLWSKTLHVNKIIVQVILLLNDNKSEKNWKQRLTYFTYITWKNIYKDHMCKKHVYTMDYINAQYIKKQTNGYVHMYNITHICPYKVWKSQIMSQKMTFVAEIRWQIKQLCIINTLTNTYLINNKHAKW